MKRLFLLGAVLAMAAFPTTTVAGPGCFPYAGQVDHEYATANVLANACGGDGGTAAVAAACADARAPLDHERSLCADGLVVLGGSASPTWAVRQDYHNGVSTGTGACSGCVAPVGTIHLRTAFGPPVADVLLSDTDPSWTCVTTNPNSFSVSVTCTNSKPGPTPGQSWRCLTVGAHAYAKLGQVQSTLTCQGSSIKSPVARASDVPPYGTTGASDLGGAVTVTCSATGSVQGNWEATCLF